MAQLIYAKAFGDMGCDDSDDSNDIVDKRITIDNRALAYGDGFFTTMGVINGQILWESYHQSRLIHHALALQFDLPIAKFWGKVKSSAENLGEGILKLVISRDSQPVRGYGFSGDAQGRACQVWLKAAAATIATNSYWQLNDNTKIPIQPMGEAVFLMAKIASYPEPLSGLKSLNRLDNVMAAGELEALKTAQPDLVEGLVRSLNGDWVEGIMSNLFYQLADDSGSNDGASGDYFSGQWFTPPIEASGVDGVMRRVILDNFKNRNPPMIRKLNDIDLPKISKLFFCNAVRGVTPVSRLWLSRDLAVDLT